MTSLAARGSLLTNVAARYARLGKMTSKEAEGDKFFNKAEKFVKPSVMSLRVKADWDSAGPLYEQAAGCYRVGSGLHVQRLEMPCCVVFIL